MACYKFLQNALKAIDANKVAFIVLFNDHNLMSNKFPQLLADLKKCMYKLVDLCNEQSKTNFLNHYYDITSNAETYGSFNIGYAQLGSDYVKAKKSYTVAASANPVASDNLILDFLKSSLLFLNTIEQDNTISNNNKVDFKEAGIGLAFNDCFLKDSFISGGGKYTARKSISKSMRRKRTARKSMRSKSMRKSMRSKYTARKNKNKRTRKRV